MRTVFVWRFCWRSCGVGRQCADDRNDRSALRERRAGRRPARCYRHRDQPRRGRLSHRVATPSFYRSWTFTAPYTVRADSKIAKLERQGVAGAGGLNLGLDL